MAGMTRRHGHGPAMALLRLSLLLVACQLLPTADAMMGSAYAIPQCSGMLSKLVPHQMVALRDAFQYQQQRQRETMAQAGPQAEQQQQQQQQQAEAGRRALHQAVPQPASLAALVAKLKGNGVLPTGVSMATLGACITARLNPKLYRDRVKFTFMVRGCRGGGGRRSVPC